MLEALLHVLLIWIVVSFVAGVVLCWIGELRARRVQRRFGKPDCGRP